MKCPFPKCRTGDIPVDRENVVEHMIVTKDNDNHFHIHAPKRNKALIQDFVIYILKEAGIDYSVAPRPEETVAPQGGKDETSEQGG